MKRKVRPQDLGYKAQDLDEFIAHQQGWTTERKRTGRDRHDVWIHPLTGETIRERDVEVKLEDTPLRPHQKALKEEDEKLGKEYEVHRVPRWSLFPWNIFEDK